MTPDKRNKPMIEVLLSDLQNQPLWREEAATAEAYYEGRHLLPEVEQEMRDRGQPVVINNYVAPTINGVLGMEAKSRTDWQVRADDEEGALVNEYLNERLNEASRMSGADRANSDAFANQAKVGVGWVEVRRNDDAFGDPYIVDTLDWASVWWDWRSKHPTLKDSRYVVIERWMDEDQAELVAPKHKELLKSSLDGWPVAASLDSNPLGPDLVAGWQTARASSITNEEWMDSDRRRVRFFDVYYRKVAIGQAMISNGNATLFDKKNPLHVALVRNNHVRLQSTRYYRMHRAIFAGPHLIHDGVSPYPHNEFPVVPFFGYREGRSRIPYGLIRGMMGPQDEVNFRRSMLTWLLKARRVVMDSDATKMTDGELHAAVARVDGIIKLDPSRKNRDSSAFSIQNEINIAAQQFQVMQDAENQIQAVSGVYNAMLGKSDGGATSGIAINSLVEQGTVTMTELYDNFRQSKQLVGNLLLNLIAEDIGNEERQVKVYQQVATKPTQPLTLNQRGPDGEVTNRVSMLGRKVVIADISSSPGYRAQMLERLMALAATMPDNIKMLMLNDILELSELPNKAELMKKIQQAIGQGVDPSQMDEAQRQAYEQEQQQKQMALAVEMAMQQAVLAEAEAQAKLTDARAELTAVQAELAANKAKTETQAPQLMAVKAQEILAKIANMQHQQSLQEQSHSNDQRGQVESLIDRLMATAQPA